VPGDILTRHASQEIKNISLERSDVASHRLGEGNVDLAQLAAVATVDTRDIQ
jgi:hypothetical protein